MGLLRPYNLFLWFSVTLICGCEINLRRSLEVGEDEEPIASVGANSLYTTDLEGLTLKANSYQDSSDMVRKYVSSWVKKQLVINKALESIEINEAEIDRKLLDYRYALIVHEYQKYYIKNKLNESVSEREIEEYYQNRLENFTLKQTIVRCLFTKLSKEAPKLKQARRLFQNYDSTKLEEIKSYCFRFAEKSYLDIESWILFDEVIANTPIMSIHNKIQFLSKKSFIEESDEDYTYFLKILEYRFPDEISPLESVKDDIRNIIISKRKVSLKNDLEDKIFEQARRNNEFKINF